METHKTATQTGAKWGVVSTIKAPDEEILEFCAYHLDQGAHRLHIYLDDETSDVFDVLKSHPKIRVTACSDTYWKHTVGRRPSKHQQRQSANAMNAYSKRADVDWLCHIDVDEFLWPKTDASIAQQLAALPTTCQTARLRPIEALAPDPSQTVPSGMTHFKACSTNRPQRTRETEAAYPTFGTQLNGGFLSHVQGKIFFRTGIEELEIKIHNVFLNGETNPNMHALEDSELCHMHASTWEDWLGSYRYRLEKGSYRAELKPAFRVENGGLTLHQLFQHIETEEGLAGLRAFFDEVCAATPKLLARLDKQGNLRSVSLGLVQKRRHYFT